MACFLGLGMTQKVKMRFFVSGEVCQRAGGGFGVRDGVRVRNPPRSEAWRWVVFLDLGVGDAEGENAIFREWGGLPTGGRRLAFGTAYRLGIRRAE